MTYILWDQLFTGNNSRILKAQFGNFAIRDWNGATTAMTSYSPFDPTTGNISSTMGTTDGFFDVGFLDENGTQVDPKLTADDLKGWQSRQILRSDMTEDQADFNATFMESTWLTDAIANQVPLAQAMAQGQEGYNIPKSLQPTFCNRQVISLGVDLSSGEPEYFGWGWPLCRMTKIDKIDINNKTAFMYQTSWTSYADPFSGFPAIFWREGPAWRASGGNTATLLAPVAAAVTGSKATLTFAPPTSDNGPFTYTVTQTNTTSSTTTTVTGGNLTITSSSPSDVVLTVAGLTATDMYTFKVQATGGNGSTSTPSPASNSITATA